MSALETEKKGLSFGLESAGVAMLEWLADGLAITHFGLNMEVASAPYSAEFHVNGGKLPLKNIFGKLLVKKGDTELLHIKQIDTTGLRAVEFGALTFNYTKDHLKVQTQGKGFHVELVEVEVGKGKKKTKKRVHSQKGVTQSGIDDSISSF